MYGKSEYQQRVEKAKYTRREGSPGNYKYYYDDKAEAKTSSGKEFEDVSALSARELGWNYDEHQEAIEHFEGKLQDAQRELDTYVDNKTREHGNDLSWVMQSDEQRDDMNREISRYESNIRAHQHAQRKIKEKNPSAGGGGSGQGTLFRSVGAASEYQQLVAKSLGESDLVKHKYTKRTGGPGNYKYFYDKPSGGKPKKEITLGTETKPQSWEGTDLSIAVGDKEIPMDRKTLSKWGELDEKASAAIREHGFASEGAQPAVSASQQAIRDHFNSYASNFTAEQHKQAFEALQDAKRTLATTRNEEYAIQGLANKHSEAADDLRDRKVSHYKGKDIHGPSKDMIRQSKKMLDEGGDKYAENHAKLESMIKDHVERTGFDPDMHATAAHQIDWARDNVASNGAERQAFAMLQRAHEEAAKAKPKKKRAKKSMNKSEDEDDTLFDGWMDDDAEDEDKGLNQAASSGFSSGTGVGAGMASPGGSVMPAIGAARQAVGTATSAFKEGKAQKAQAQLDIDQYSHHGVDCVDCKAGTCPHNTSKALTSRSMAIPFYLRGPQKYDPNDIFRSATQQTSRMYTSLAPAVAETMQHAAAEETKRTQNDETHKSCAAHGVIHKSQECPVCVSMKSMRPRTGFLGR